MKLFPVLVFLSVLALLAACGGESGDKGKEEAAPAQAPAPAATQECVLTIEGMTCQNCVNTIERVLSRCPGVTEAVVNLESGTGMVKGNGMQASDLQLAVEKAGYAVAGVEGPAVVTGAGNDTESSGE